MARAGVGASDMASRVSAPRAKERMSMRRTPMASTTEPTRKTKSEMRMENVADHQPAFSSDMPKSPESQRGRVGRKEKTPRNSKKVARYTSHSSRGHR